MARLLIAICALCMMAGPASAEPISFIVSTIVSAALATAGVSATATIIGTLTVAQLATAVIITAIGIGLQLAFAPKPPKPPPPESGIVAVQQTIPYRIFGYGLMPCAGALMLKEEKAGYLVYVAAISGHQVTSFEGLYLNDDLVTVPIVSGKLDGVVSAGADNRYLYSSIKIGSRLGIPTETYYDFIADKVPTEWTVAHRGDTCASIAMLCNPVAAQAFSTVYPYGAPSPRPVIKWVECYDWRDPSQLLGSPSTWEWTQNTVLHVVHHMCHSQFGFLEDFSSVILPNIEEWTDAADDCEDAMALKAGGTEERYHSNGFSTTETGAGAILLTLLQSCDGHMVRAGGTYRLKVGKFKEPEVIITDDDIAQVYFQNGQMTEDRTNEATAKYTSPQNAYASVDTDPVIDADDQAARPGAPRKSQLDLSWVHSKGQASRLLRREMKRQSEPLRGKLTLYWSGINAAYERWIRVQSNSIPKLSNVVLENMKSTISAKTMRIDFDFMRSGSYVDDYDPATDESNAAVVSQRPTTVGLPIPANVSAVGTLLTDLSGQASVVLVITFDEPVYGSSAWQGLNFTSRYRLADDGSGNPGPWVDQSYSSAVAVGGTITVQTNPVPSDDLEVQVASVATGATLSTYSTLQTVSTRYEDLAPLKPTWISAVSGVGSVTLNVTSPNSANFYAVQFYEATTGAGFGAASPIGSPVTGARNSTITYVRSVSAGTRDYFAVAQTSVPVNSSPVGPQAGTST